MCQEDSGWFSGLPRSSRSRSRRPRRGSPRPGAGGSPAGSRQGDRCEGEARRRAARQAGHRRHRRRPERGRQARHQDLQGEAGRRRCPRRARRRPRRDGHDRDSSWRAPRTDRFPRPVPIGVSSGISTRRDRHARRARHERHERLRALEQPRLRGRQHATIGDPIIQPGNVDGGNDPPTASARSHDLPDDRLQRRRPTRWTRRSRSRRRRTSAPRRRPTATGRRARSRRRRSSGQAVQKYGRTTGFQLGTVATTNVTVDVCYLSPRSSASQEARFVGPDLDHARGRSARPGDSGRSSSPRAETSPSRSFRGRRRPHDR